MNSHAQPDSLEVAGNPRNSLSLRLRSLRELPASNDKSLIAGLKALLQRRRPDLQEKAKNWDPEADERMVDLAIVEALHKLGDDSEIGRVPVIVAQAGQVLQDPVNELDSAVLAILHLGQVAPVSGLIEITNNQNPQALRNAVKTLDRLRLPEAPLGGSVASVPHMQDRVTFTIHKLAEELRAFEQYSQGSLRLSADVRTFLLDHDFDRGVVRRQGVSLADTLENTIPLLDFDYYVEQNRVVICTYTEAGARWRAWWSSYGPNLEYRKQKSLFVLRGRE